MSVCVRVCACLRVHVCVCAGICVHVCAESYQNRQISHKNTYCLDGVAWIAILLNNLKFHLH